MKKKAKVVAFYLPQFHPIPQNDEWWGKGFTEWTNVGKAKAYFPGHYQPRVPADLGYYNLLSPEIREAQAELAIEAGIDAFCYWHYWFGNGKQLLEKPLEEVIKCQSPNFPFCLGWANHDWSKKNWNSSVSRFDSNFLIKQTYPDEEDVDKHFYKMLPMFKDSRYYKVNNKLLFYIYQVDSIPNFSYFRKRWQELATQNNLSEFYFVAGCTSIELLNRESIQSCDAVALDLKNRVFKTKSLFRRRISYFFPFPVNVKTYSYAIKKMNHKIFKEEKVYPVVYPNWDHSPRVGKSATIMHRSTPELFKKYINDIIEIISGKNVDDKIIFLKSWNEWAEGNYLEPDLKYGKKYIQVLNSALLD